uniref:Uncharacterized protein n=1 Tax=Plectus sambesii TaxID=2011161 RepID=A0A914UJK6_9BILA
MGVTKGEGGRLGRHGRDSRAASNHGQAMYLLQSRPATYCLYQETTRIEYDRLPVELSQKEIQAAPLSVTPTNQPAVTAISSVHPTCNLAAV